MLSPDGDTVSSGWETWLAVINLLRYFEYDRSFFISLILFLSSLLTGMITSLSDIQYRVHY